MLGRQVKIGVLAHDAHVLTPELHLQGHHASLARHRNTCDREMKVLSLAKCRTPFVSISSQSGRLAHSPRTRVASCEADAVDGGMRGEKVSDLRSFAGDHIENAPVECRE